MSKKPSSPTDHPAVAAAKRAIRRTFALLTPAQTFELAARAEIFALGEDKGRWLLSQAHAAGNPDHVWRCDGIVDPTTKRGAR